MGVEEEWGGQERGGSEGALDTPSGWSLPRVPPPRKPPALAAQQGHCEEEPVPFPRMSRAQNLLERMPQLKERSETPLKPDSEFWILRPGPLLLGCVRKPEV